MPGYKPLSVRVFGSNHVEIRRGKKAIHLDQLSTWGEALHFGEAVARAAACPCYHKASMHDEERMFYNPEEDNARAD